MPATQTQPRHHPPGDAETIPAAPPRRRWPRRLLRVALGVLVVLLGLVATTFWWVFVRDDTPEEAQLVERTTAATPATELTGTWAVAPGPDVWAGYRIDEVVGGTLENTAVARTPDVAGELVVDGTEITAVDITADLTALESQDDQVPNVGNRDAAMRDRGLETDAFPTASFTLTEPIDLGAPPEPGAEVTIDAVGELDLHGIARPVTVPVAARWNGEVIDLTASVALVLADHGIEQPAAAIVTVAEEGILELQLTLVPADPG